uniref:Uncharacterized protein n=1 Tax=Palpitomonas bilix TaxID=652834 RepID=A0A7S3DDU6_9EUKA|mmetsp:Transcript_3300/g.6445  ORF Transcript_3300/g.6445 Transcript_3300/m.6445 type:complete len:355 (+) Transcript_3300:241-1305(+)
MSVARRLEQLTREFGKHDQIEEVKSWFAQEVELPLLDYEQDAEREFSQVHDAKADENMNRYSRRQAASSSASSTMNALLPPSDRSKTSEEYLDSNDIPPGKIILLDATRRENQELKLQLDELHKQMKNDQSQVEECLSEFVEDIKRYEGLYNEASEKVSIIPISKMKNEFAVEQVKEVERERDEVMRKLDELQSLCRTITDERDSALREATLLQGELKNLSADGNDCLAEERRKLEVDRLEAEKYKLRKEREELRLKVEELQRSLSGQSVPNDSVPSASGCSKHGHLLTERETLEQLVESNLTASTLTSPIEIAEVLQNPHVRGAFAFLSKPLLDEICELTRVVESLSIVLKHS